MCTRRRTGTTMLRKEKQAEVQWNVCTQNTKGNPKKAQQGRQGNPAAKDKRQHKVPIQWGGEGWGMVNHRSGAGGLHTGV